VVEHYLDTVGVTGSNPVSRTIFFFFAGNRPGVAAAFQPEAHRPPDTTFGAQAYSSSSGGLGLRPQGPPFRFPVATERPPHSWQFVVLENGGDDSRVIGVTASGNRIRYNVNSLAEI
jgi:hypothetical protein